MSRKNALDQPIGFDVDNWTPRPKPSQTTTITGQYCRLEPLQSEHASDLHAANLTDTEDRIWTYLGYGPFETLDAYIDWVQDVTASDDPLFYAIIDQRSGKACGVASYLRIMPDVGSIEVGHINFAPPLQGTRAATEAMYLMMRHAFEDLGYRRYEWKCDNFNERSRNAAARLGFVFEGIFRQCTMYKGRNRDTAWFSIIDADWPPLREAFSTWLAAENFDADGQQRTSLSELTASVRGVSPIAP